MNTETVAPERATAPRVLLVHNRYLEPVGGENAVVEMQRSLFSRRGCRVSVYLRESRELQATPGLRIAAAAGLVSGRWDYRELDQVIDAGRPEVAVVHNVYPLIGNDVHAHLRRRGIATVQVIHAMRYTCLNGLHFREGQICERCHTGHVLPGVVRGCYRGSVVQSALQGTEYLRTRWLAPYHRHVDRFVALTRFAAGRLQAAGVPAERIRVIPNAFREAPALGVDPAAGTHVLFLGRLSAEKGVDVLVRALAGAGVPVIVAGDGPERATLEELATSLGGNNIRFVGVMRGEDKQALIDRARIVAFPSIWFEGFPLALLEGMAAGRAVVASRLGGIPEIARDGVEARLCPPGDVAAWRAAILSLWNDVGELRRMGAQARQRAQEYSEDRYWNDWMNLLAELMPARVLTAVE